MPNTGMCRLAICPGNQKALATVTAIIDGCGSCGAALGPLLTGYLAQLRGGFDNVFAMLYVASLAAALLLSRLVVREVGPARLVSPSVQSACWGRELKEAMCLLLSILEDREEGAADFGGPGDVGGV